LNLDVGKDACFDVAFSMLDKDNSEGLDIHEFMRFLKMARDHEGPFKNPDKTKVNMVKGLDRMDLMLLMKCFEDRDITEDKAKPEDQLMHEACILLDVEPTTNLESAFHVSTLQELLEHAKWRAQEVSKNRRSTSKHNLT